MKYGGESKESFGFGGFHCRRRTRHSRGSRRPLYSTMMARSFSPQRFLVLLFAVLIGGGCHHLPTKTPKKNEKPPKAIAVPAPIYIGKIALVNETARFVLIDSGLAAAPPSGVVLTTYTGNLQSGELLATNVRRHPFLIADIRKGDPCKGDKVYYDPYHGPAQSPAPAPEAPRPSQPGSMGLPNAPEFQFPPSSPALGPAGMPPEDQ